MDSSKRLLLLLRFVLHREWICARCFARIREWGAGEGAVGAGWGARGGWVQGWGWDWGAGVDGGLVRMGGINDVCDWYIGIRACNCL